MKTNRKIAVFDELIRYFVRDTETGPDNNKSLFCQKTEDAYNFGSIRSARKWAEGSGFSNLVVVIVLS